MEDKNMVTTETQGTTETAQEQKGFFRRAIDAAVRVRDKVNASKTGRFILKTTKYSLLLCTGKFLYDLGKKHGAVTVNMIGGTTTDTNEPDEATEEVMADEQEQEHD